jgi:signal transduction histidine kinase
VDPALIERILENLVMNAIKHTPAGTAIWVRASHVKGQLHIKVEDAGGGVPDELKTRIFEAFEQGEVPMHSPGTGVGLSLVSQFAKLHGGRAWVQDRRGGGASFRVVVPATPAKKAA